MTETSHIIPPITEPMGKYWEQPSREDILIDDSYAVMSQSTFDELHEYSCSNPTGVYPGKMWRVDYQSYCPDFVRLGKHRHWLRWYGESSDPKMCSNHYRRILIV